MSRVLSIHEQQYRDLPPEVRAEIDEHKPTTFAKLDKHDVVKYLKDTIGLEVGLFTIRMAIADREFPVKKIGRKFRASERDVLVWDATRENVKVGA